MDNVKITGLDATTGLALTDLLAVVDDPSGSPATQKATFDQVRALLAALPVNTQTADYTLVLSDAGKTVEMDVASANNLTVPPNASVAFPIGTVIEVFQLGAGQTTIVAGSGVTIRTPETLLLRGQYSTASLRKRATDTWVLAGDVQAAP